MGKSISSKRILLKRGSEDLGMVEFSVRSLGLRKCPGSGVTKFKRDED